MDFSSNSWLEAWKALLAASVALPSSAESRHITHSFDIRFHVMHCLL